MGYIDTIRQQAQQRIGSCMGQWQLTEIIGLGASGAVYAAHDGTRHGALKTLHTDRQASNKIRKRFEREAQVTRELAHPNIVEIMEIDTDEAGEIYLVMERLQGHALDDMMRRFGNKLSLEQAMFVMKGLLAALDRAHSKKVIHRDIKPANIFITQNPMGLKLLDFGVAHDDSSDQQLTQDGAVLGTPAFMPPEQARGRRDMLDERSDLFACGALLYTMLSGKLTHHSQSPEEALLFAATRPCESVAKVAPKLPPELIAVVDKALSWNPSQRFQSARQMWAALLDTANQSATPAQPEQKSRQVEKAAALAQNAARLLQDTEHDEPIDTDAATGIVAQIQRAFQSFERSLDAARKYGTHHQEVEQQTERAFEALMDCTQSASLHITIKPYSFNARGDTVWEPGAPFDDIPYNLFAAGVRGLTFDAGMTRDEFRQISALLRCDPRRDLPPEDDLGMALWEGNFAHLELHMVNAFRLGDQEEQAHFTRSCMDAQQHVMLQLEGLQAEHMQRAQLVLALGESALAQIASQSSADTSRADGQPSHALPLSRQELTLLVGALGLPSGATEKRAPYTIATAYELGRELPDTSRFLEALKTAFTRWNRQLPVNEILSTYAQIIKSLSDRQARYALTEALFDEEMTTRLFGRLHDHDFGAPQGLPTLGLRALLASLPAHLMPQVCELYANAHKHELVHNACTSFLVEHIAEQPEPVGELIPKLPLSHARTIIDLVKRLEPSVAVDVLRHVARREEEELELEVLEWRATHEPALVSTEFKRLASSPNVEVRIRSLQLAQRLHISSIDSFLSSQIDPDDFSRRPYSERRLLMMLLLEHDPYSARDKAVALLSSRHMSGAHTTSRQLAIEVLSKVPASPALLGALEEASRRRPWNPKAVQDAARQALDHHKQERSS